MGVKKLLQQGLEEEKKYLSEASLKKSTPKSKDTKNKGGRPKFEDTGKICRKQYSVTLLPSDYEKILKTANEEGLSFSKYLERAAFTYMEQHNSNS